MLGPKFLHVYLNRPKELIEKAVSNADENGYRAIVVTCDHSSDRIRDFMVPLFNRASIINSLEVKKNMSCPNMDLPYSIGNRDAKSKFSKSGVFRKKSGVYQEIFYETSKVIKRYSNELTQVLTCLINANTPIHFVTE